MIIDLTLHPHRLTFEQYRGSLVLRMNYGDVYISKPSRIEIPPAYSEPGPPQVLLFKLLPTEMPSYEDDDAIGWDFHVHETDKDRRGHGYYTVTLWRPPGSRAWSCRYRESRTLSSLDIGLAGFDPTEDTWRLPENRTAWDRLVEDEA